MSTETVKDYLGHPCQVAMAFERFDDVVARARTSDPRAVTGQIGHGLNEMSDRLHHMLDALKLANNAAAALESWTNPENVNHPAHSVQQRYALRRALMAELDGILAAIDPECSAILGVQHG